MKLISKQKKTRTSIVLLFLILPLFTLIPACCSSNSAHPVKGHKKSIKKEALFKVDYPKSNTVLHTGESFKIQLSSLKKVNPSLVTISTDGKVVTSSKESDFIYKCSTLELPTGKLNVNVKINYSDSLTESHHLNLILLPSAAPAKLNYKVIRSIKHDPEAYTQGLIYYKGYLYESTGQPNRSSLRCIDPKTGEILRKRKIEPQYFGEGIALIGSDVYMLTYKARKGFVFNISNFELEREFSLQTEEGWGLTTNGKELILTDGSAYLYYYAPEYFTLNKQIEVCDNKSIVNYLNELELTPDGIYANVYGQKYIVLINPGNGIVTHVLDLSAIFPKNIPDDMDHVLNGIAYDPDSKTFYVTGKEWPVMYEIKVLPH